MEASASGREPSPPPAGPAGVCQGPHLAQVRQEQPEPRTFQPIVLRGYWGASGLSQPCGAAVEACFCEKGT